jgi:xanthine dehydrogenase large subunit
LPDSFVTTRVRRMGGGFGGKETQATQWAVIAALAARATGRPCKLRLDRDADMADDRQAPRFRGRLYGRL